MNYNRFFLILLRVPIHFDRFPIDFYRFQKIWQDSYEFNRGFLFIFIGFQQSFIGSLIILMY